MILSNPASDAALLRCKGAAPADAAAGWSIFYLPSLEPLVSALTEITVDTKCWVASWISGQPAPPHAEEWDPLAALDEIAEDLGLGRCRTALWMPMAMTLALCPTAAGTVWLCGLTLSTKASYVSVSALTALGALSMLNRTPDEPDRTIHRQCFTALATCSLVRLLQLYLGGAPELLVASCARPEVAMFFMQDLVVSPMVILNMAHLVGAEPQDVCHCIGWSLLSTLSAIGAAAAAPAHGSAATLLLLSFGFMGLAAQGLGRLPADMPLISPVNKQRSRIAGDLIMFSWTLSPLVHGLGLASVITVEQQVHLFGMLDVICKMGVCHIMLRDRNALRNSARHFQSRPGRPRHARHPGPGLLEPCSEPPPQSDQ